MLTTTTPTEVCSLSVARTPTGRVRVSSAGGPFRVITLSVDEAGARVALVPNRALLLAGDVVGVSVAVAEGLALHLQETSGTVAYDMRGGCASWSLDAAVAADAALVLDSLPWVSAEGSRVSRSLTVALQAGSSLVARETLVLGRTGEDPGSLVSTTILTREGRPVLVEEQRSAHLAPYRILDSVLAVGVPGAGPHDGPSALRLETGDRIWRKLGREAHETAAALDPVWGWFSG